MREIQGYQRNLEDQPQEEVRVYAVPWGSPTCSTKHGNLQILECCVRVGLQGLRCLRLCTGPGGPSDNPLSLYPAGEGIRVRQTHYHHHAPSIVTLPTLCQKLAHRQDKTPLSPESGTQPKERWGEGELGHQGSKLRNSQL